MIPYYVGAGDLAAASVVAHEFGHALQARLPQREPLTLLSELQADCSAAPGRGTCRSRGCWSRATSTGPPSRSSPRATSRYAGHRPAAHGTGLERTRAFTDGSEDGPGACYPAPRGDWLVDGA